MISRNVTVRIPVGLHARPATFFIQKANSFKSSIWVEKGDRRVNSKSLLGVLSLGITKDTEITLIADGADEIDMVLSVGKFLEGNLEECADEITEMKGCVGDKVLKVILETCLLGRLELISEASLLAMVCGADFIKTSTGKEKTGATPEGAWAMCKSIRQFFEREGVKVGFKAAGGIRKIEDAMRYLTIAEMILGKEWIEEGKFRIGTSGLEGF